MNDHILSLLGDDASFLLEHRCKGIDRDRLHAPGPDFIDRVWTMSDRNNRALGNLTWIYQHGRLAGTGYMSILPVDQGIEHAAGASFAKNPDYFDPERIVELAMEGGCNAVASTFGVLGSVARKYAHKIPFLVKFNHNQLLTIVEVAEAFAYAHELGMATVLWCYLRNSAFKKDQDYHASADLTGQANHLGVTIQADIIKQKLPENNGGYVALNADGVKYGRFDQRIYDELTTDHPIDLCRYQVANCYMGRVGLINSGGASGDNDFADAVRTAVINKRAGGTGLISGRKAFQRPMTEGVELLNHIQDVYLDDGITLA
jgi:class I fructose-bisphosphate aldolase